MEVKKLVIAFLFFGVNLFAQDSLVVEEDSVLDVEPVTITRSSRSIKNIPTRIETIAGEELEEKANMKPGDIRMVLSESTGIQTQQTSATSGNSGIRIQGLEGRYTQIMKDGFPLFSGYSGGLSIMQTPPLDLKRVEVIKGSASTLYGGGAIAGVVNLVSKTPKEKPEFNVMLNATSAKGFDASAFYAKRGKKTGITLFYTYNGNKAYDPAGIDLSAIPQLFRYTFNPKLFFYLTPKTTVTLAFSGSFEDRIGGDLHYINNNGKSDTVHSYFEKNTTFRASAQLTAEHKITDNSSVSLKQSVSNFHRQIALPKYLFEGEQKVSYTEFSYANKNEKREWIIGANAWLDDFKEIKHDTLANRSASQNIYGIFLQNTYNASEKITVETGLRGDYVYNYEFIGLPKISILYKLSSKWSTRLGGGLGYKTPSIFTEKAEQMAFQNVLPIQSSNPILEKSIGYNYDINYRGNLFNNKLKFTFNEMLFLTRLNNPMLLTMNSKGNFYFVNASGHLFSKGLESNAKFEVGDLKLFLGYTYTVTKTNYNAVINTFPLTPKHRVNLVLMYEIEEKLKMGLEAYYFGQQNLSNGNATQPYWICGFMAEKLWEKFSVYINFENFLDLRQTRFESIYTGTQNNPQFKEIYAPLDGRVINAGIKIKM